MTGILVRAALPDDAEDIEALRVATWRVAYRGMVPDAYLDTMPLSADHRRLLITGRPDGGDCVAVVGGRLVGWTAYGTCRDADRAGPRYGEVYACYVDAAWWRRRVGGLLMGAAVTALEATGRRHLSLWVLEDNTRARRFYQHLGFRADGTVQVLDLGAPVREVRYLRNADADL